MLFLCGFKTFTPCPPVMGATLTSCRRFGSLGFAGYLSRKITQSEMGEFQVATTGGVWVAAGVLGCFSSIRCRATRFPVRSDKLFNAKGQE